MATRATSVFLGSAAMILALTAVLKLASLGSDAKFMTMRDPVIFFLTERQLMGIAAVGELAFVAYLIRSANGKARLLMIAWLGLLFLTYHFCVALSGVNLSCACLGDVFAWTQIGRRVFQVLPLAMAAYFLLGSCALLALHRQQALREAATAERGRPATPVLVAFKQHDVLEG